MIFFQKVIDFLFEHLYLYHSCKIQTFFTDYFPIFILFQSVG